MKQSEIYQGEYFPFGKYKGQPFELVCRDQGYIMYVFENFDPDKFRWILERLQDELSIHNPQLFHSLESRGYFEEL